MFKRSKFVGLQIAAITSLAITSLIVGVRHLGLLQSLELGAYDQMLRSRPIKPMDERLLIVKVTEEDIIRFGNSLSDARLNKLLTKLELYQARVIGLNVYRPRQKNLGANLIDRNSIVSVCKFSSYKVSEIPPPSNLPKDNIGFNDLIADSSDRTVRRALLSGETDDKECNTKYSFAALASLIYLEKQGIKTSFNNGNWVFGNQVIPFLQGKPGSYEDLDLSGYQILLNYRHPNSLARTVTLTEVLNNQINPNWVKDKLVIIGNTASSLDRGISTPYGSPNQPSGTPGVFIQAQVVSQILSTVLDGQRQIWYLPDLAEIICIFSFSMMGAIIAWNLRPSFLNIALLTGGSIASLYLICLLAFVQLSCWLPIIPFILTLLATGANVLIYSKLYLYPISSRRLFEDYLQNPETAQDEIEALIRSSNHNLQTVAAIALGDIAVDILMHCQTLSDIADISFQLSWIPSPPPKQIGTALPQLLSVSEDVWASTQYTTFQSRYELLNRPIKALQNLLKSLAFEKNLLSAGALHEVCSKWLKILETAQRTLQSSALQEQEIRQVYVAGNALDPETAMGRFKGRVDIFREIETLTLIESPPVLLMYGGRRTGKTSTLKYLSHRVGSTIVPLLVDLQGAASATTLEGLAKNLVTQIIEAGRRLPRRLDLPYPNFTNSHSGVQPDAFIDLQNWFAEIERVYPEKRFLLCLDEFERLSEVVTATNSRVPLNFIRNILQHRRQWIVLFSGSHTFSELPTYWSDYLINTRTVRVSFLDEESARNLIIEPVKDFPKIYDSLAVDKIIELTNCQPYLIQLICYEVVELINREIRSGKRESSNIIADIDNINSIIPLVLERGNQYFQELWNSLKDNEKDFLFNLTLGKKTIDNNKGVIRELIQKEILTIEGNNFQVPLVQKFIEQIISEIT
ncbi:hypothetical protein NIES4071_24410 [Calothrix sp. NIES-4071]|nr:hypothetical protein NIES4071_24410 [Calothrix sp. NIES-4071]BAZ56764.1 hypothetical protein NIES4105_24350 [Calothrix sp. NIES-4105]